MLATKNQQLQVNGLSLLPSPDQNAQTALMRLDSNEFQQQRAALLNGDVVNISEARSAWHTACRQPQPNDTVAHYLDLMRTIVDTVRHGKFNDLAITDVVNIGIGGSDLGPKLVCEAFADAIDGPTPHFVSNLDSGQLQTLLSSLHAKHTLFIVTSKSFRTLETLENMQLAQQWLREHNQSWHEHIIAISSNQTAVIDHGIPAHQFLPLPEWVGGRFSLWSAVGLSCAIALGFETFHELLQGAHAMDVHFSSTAIEQNIPLIYAANLHHQIQHNDINTLAILPYAHALRSLTEYLQQLFMESLGKSVNPRDRAIDHKTGPMVFGGPGTNCQHSYQQLMMQGTHPLVADYILPLKQPNHDDKTQALLAANCLTQVKTLRHGSGDEPNVQKQIKGGQIANLVVLEQLTPSSLGSLLAMYEHAVFCLAYLMDINPFDQWGVEYAKSTSQALFTKLKQQALSIDTITESLNT